MKNIGFTWPEPEPSQVPGGHKDEDDEDEGSESGSSDSEDAEDEVEDDVTGTSVGGEGVGGRETSDGVIALYFTYMFTSAQIL